MGKAKAILRSMRFRTIPLSVAGVLLGSMLALADYHIRMWTVVLLVLTAAALQILSNLANELGDVQHGTDTTEREGPLYGLNSGDLDIDDMKLLVKVFVLVSIVLGLLMVWVSFGTLFSVQAIGVEILGAAAIWAAIRYTVGKNPYGHRGLGDVFVFIFYGLVTVMGGFYVCAHCVPLWPLILPACAIGFFSVGVLNVNNIRDMKTDARVRTTVAMRLGPVKARVYQSVLIALGWISMILYCLCRYPDPWHWLFVLTLPLYILHIVGIWKKTDRGIDAMLPQLVVSTLLFSVLAGGGFIIFLI